jgi:tripartite-type tricarboxylate transporter receptor subunit TctC
MRAVAAGRRSAIMTPAAAIRWTRPLPVPVIAPAPVWLLRRLAIRIRRHALPLALACCLGFAGGAAADDFYKGKTISLVVANAAGGGYDLYARLLARHMGRHIPGEPGIVVKYQGGAGGLVMANAIYSATPRDGLTIGLMARANPLERILGNPAAKFENEAFTWLGTTSSYQNDAYCLFVRADLPVRSIADAQRTTSPLVFGGVAAGGTDTDLLLVARNIFGMNLKLVRGYAGVPDINLAMRRGEVDGQASGISALRNSFGDWLREGKLRFLVQFGHEARWSELPDVPTAYELAAPDDRGLVELAELPLKMARPFIAPPALLPERAKILQRAFMETQTDPAYLAEARDLQIDISPLSADEMQRLLRQLAASPPALVQRYQDILAAK